MDQLSLDAFTSYRFLSNLNYSPDASCAALVSNSCNTKDNSYDSYIYIYRNNSWTRFTSSGKERSFIWEDETHLLFPACRTKEEEEKLKSGCISTTYYRICINGGEAQPAFTLPFAAGTILPANNRYWLIAGEIPVSCPDYYKLSEEERKAWEKEQKDNEDYEVLTEIPFYANGGGFIDKKRTALFLYDRSENSSVRISDSSCSVMDFVMNGDDVYYLGSDYKNKASYLDSEIYHYSISSGRTRQLTHGEKVFSFLFILKNTLYAAACEKYRYAMNPEESFYRVDPESGTLSLFAPNTASLFNSTGSDCRFGGQRSVKVVNDILYYTATVRNACHLYSLDSAGRIRCVLSREGAVDDFDLSSDGKLILTGMYDNRLEEVYETKLPDPSMLPADLCSLNRISDFNSDVLKTVYIAPYEKLTISSCGWDIDGWILRPKDYDPQKSYPAILDIHGGPRTVYGEIFYHEMQYWANQGYFVFFCNPVGGSGRGLEFADISGRYGEIDYQNIMDFTDTVLKKYPQIDPSRVGCTGGSYGGFMSNWILGHTDRFAAIATQRSISNWISFFGVSDIGFDFTRTQIQADPYTEEGVKKLWEHSPLKYAASMKTPTLFIHSNEDYRCPMEQGMQLFTALKDRGVPARMCYFKGENHELSRSGKPLHRIRRLKEITDWMDLYVKGGSNGR